MKKTILLLCLLLVSSKAYADISGKFNVQETDGSPSVYPYAIKVPQGTLTDNGDGTATASQIGSFGVTVDGGGSTITQGLKGYITIPYSCTIKAWNIVADGSSPTCTFDIWKVGTGTALPVVANSIMGTKPALSSGNAIHSTTLNGWSTTIISNDIVAISLDAVTVATRINFIVETTKS